MMADTDTDDIVDQYVGYSSRSTGQVPDGIERNPVLPLGLTLDASLSRYERWEVFRLTGILGV
jgi:hypothetical protein